jgi:hypothetical protein
MRTFPSVTLTLVALAPMVTVASAQIPSDSWVFSGMQQFPSAASPPFFVGNPAGGTTLDVRSSATVSVTTNAAIDGWNTAVVNARDQAGAWASATATAPLPTDWPTAGQAVPQASDGWTVATPSFPTLRRGPTYFQYSQAELDRLRSLAPPHERLSATDLTAWDATAMDIVRRRALSPPAAARLYSTIAVAQRDAMLLSRSAGGESRSAIDAVSAGVVCRIAPEDCPQSRPADAFAAALTEMILQRVDERLRADSLALPPVNPSPGPMSGPGAGVWQGTDPTASSAAGWTSWHDTRSVSVPFPPAVGTPEDSAQMLAVRDALAAVTPEQREAVRFWAGGRGTETPGGIWLGIAGRALADENADAARAADVRAATMMAVHDGFILCWKTKFTHWTARPNQRDASIVTLIPTPNFPSYPSGHATISGAASRMLASFFPDRSAELDAQAEEAASSRLWGGIHFPIDNASGLAAGRQIAADAIAMRP